MLPQATLRYSFPLVYWRLFSHFVVAVLILWFSLFGSAGDLGSPRAAEACAIPRFKANLFLGWLGTPRPPVLLSVARHIAKGGMALEAITPFNIVLIRAGRFILTKWANRWITHGWIVGTVGRIFHGNECLSQIGGNAKTLMIACLSPSFYSETEQTMKFASRYPFRTD